MKNDCNCGVCQLKKELKNRRLKKELKNRLKIKCKHDIGFCCGDCLLNPKDYKKIIDRLKK